MVITKVIRNFFAIRVKAYFSYRPDRDELLPEKGAGVDFKAGDVLQVLDKSDKLFWQAENLRTHQHGLIPSEWLEDRRRTKKIQKEAKKTQVSLTTQTKLFSASHSQVQCISSIASKIINFSCSNNILNYFVFYRKLPTKMCFDCFSCYFCLQYFRKINS